jgi:hypothetical protein
MVGTPAGGWQLEYFIVDSMDLSGDVIADYKKAPSPALNSHLLLVGITGSSGSI